MKVDGEGETRDRLKVRISLLKVWLNFLKVSETAKYIIPASLQGIARRL